jgi:hypothetical protein
MPEIKIQEASSRDHGNSSGSSINSNETGPKQCWICFGEDTVATGDMIRPCKCKGTSGWVHHSCLLDWIQVRSGDSASYASLDSRAIISPSCPQCSTPYIIQDRYSLPSKFIRLIISIKRWRDRILVVSLISGAIICLYTFSWGYGLCSFAFIVGPNEFNTFFKHHLMRCFKNPSSDSLIKTFVGLPLITLGLLSWNFNTLSWVFPLLPPILFANDSISWNFPPSSKLTAILLPVGLFSYRFLWSRAYPYISSWWLSKFGIKTEPDIDTNSLLSEISPQTTNNSNSTIDETETDFLDDRELRISLLSLTANLTFPFAASFLGFLLFGKKGSMFSTFHKSIMGGLVLLSVQDLAHFILWWQRIAIKPFRRVLNFRENNG